MKVQCVNVYQKIPYEATPLSSPHPNLNRFLLPNGERVACVFWNGLYHITGTDIGQSFASFGSRLTCEAVRALVFRFEAFSRPVRNMKKLGIPKCLAAFRSKTDVSTQV